jgi:hypothetical protein
MTLALMNISIHWKTWTKMLCTTLTTPVNFNCTCGMWILTKKPLTYGAFISRQLYIYAGYLPFSDRLETGRDQHCDMSVVDTDLYDASHCSLIVLRIVMKSSEPTHSMPNISMICSIVIKTINIYSEMIVLWAVDNEMVVASCTAHIIVQPVLKSLGTSK